MRKVILLGEKKNVAKLTKFIGANFFGTKKIILIKPSFKSVQKVTGFMWYGNVIAFGSCDP